MGSSERLNLRWDDFEANARLSFTKLRDEMEFHDVTVVADCGKQVEASKVVLAGGAEFFHKILKENPHPHPLIYLKGVAYKHLVHLLDFVYTGETSIDEDDVNDFLDIAQDLRVKGLTVHGTLETTSNQTTPRNSLPNPVAAREACPSPRVSQACPSPRVSQACLSPRISQACPSPRVSQACPSPRVSQACPSPRVSQACPSPRVSHPHPHCVTSAAPAPHQGQVAPQEPGPSLEMLRPSRPQSLTSCNLPDLACASHQRQIFAEEAPPPTLSQLHSAKAALPRGQVAAKVSSSSISNPHSAKSAPPQCKVAANETTPSPPISYPHNLKSAPHHYQVAAERHVQSFRIPHPHQGQVAAEESAQSLGMPRPRSVISSHLNNALSPASCDKDHDNTCHVKVEVGDAEHYNVAYGVNDHDEAYMRHFSIRGLVGNEGNINFDEDTEGIVLSVEPDQNGEVISNGNEIKEEIMESRNDMVIREEADQVFEDGQMSHDWYEQGEESENMILGRNKYDKSNMIPDGEQDLADKTKSSEDTDFQCSLCSVTFTTASQLRRHNKSHIDEKQFARPVRSKMSSQMGSLNKRRIQAEEEQLKSNHTGDKPHQCLLSSKKKSLRKNLIQHNMIHHKMANAQKKPYQCVICSKSISQLGNLKLHMMIHTGEKPHQCLQCSKSFIQLGNFKKHMMTHTGEKPHQCEVCFKRFSLLESLKRHKICE